MKDEFYPRHQSRKDRAVQLTASIQNTKMIIAGNHEFVFSQNNYKYEQF